MLLFWKNENIHKQHLIKQPIKPPKTSLVEDRNGGKSEPEPDLVVSSDC